MAKLLGKRFDEELFNHFSIIDWRYYQSMIDKDEEEELEKFKWAAEYVASFINPDAVKKVWDSRGEGRVYTNNQEIEEDNGEQYIQSLDSNSVQKHKSVYSGLSRDEFMQSANQLFGNL